MAEAIQTVLRREGYSKPYEALKGLTRTNDTINKQSIADFIDTLNISDELKVELKLINPSTTQALNLFKRFYISIRSHPSSKQNGIINWPTLVKKQG